MEEPSEQTQEHFSVASSQKTEEKIVFFKPFQQQYEQSRQKYSDELADKITSLLKYRQQRTYNLIVNDKSDYFSYMWEYMQKQLKSQSPYFQPDLITMVSERQNNIVTELLDNKLQIEFHKLKPFQYQEELKQKKISMLRDQSTQIQRKLIDINEGMDEIKIANSENSQSRFKPFQIKEEKLKQYEQFMKKQKKEREERTKLQEEQRKKDQQLRLKKQQQQKDLREKQAKQRKQELIKKLRQSEQKRQKEKLERQQRSKDYKFISKSLAQQPPLFKKLEQNYYHRYQQTQIQKRKKAMSERHSMFQAIDTKAIEQHQKKYQDLRLQKERQRRQRMQQYEKMIEMQQEQMQAKYKSNLQIKTTYIDKKSQQRRLALEKKQKMKKFIEQTVKQRYLPRIDQEKRKQFLKIIEEMNSKKKMKKVKKQDGTYEYQQIKVGDPRMVGLQYLEMTKQMAMKMRGKRKNSDNTPLAENEKPRIYDYLAQQRKKGTSKSHRDRMEFVNKKGLTFDDKLKKVQLQSEKLEQLAKQKQMKLKFGKFTTSEEILQHKQQIDQHYIDIINMKLKLINLKQE